MLYDCLINIRYKKHNLVKFLTLWLTFHSVVYFSTGCSKIAWGFGPLCEHRQGDAFFIYWQQYIDNVVLQLSSSVPVASWLYKHS